jgi:hypothetical protein
MQDLIKAGAIKQEALDEIEWIFGFNFSKDVDPMKLEMRQGFFY